MLCVFIILLRLVLSPAADLEALVANVLEERNSVVLITISSASEKSLFGTAINESCASPDCIAIFSLSSFLKAARNLFICCSLKSAWMPTIQVPLGVR